MVRRLWGLLAATLLVAATPAFAASDRCRDRLMPAAAPPADGALTARTLVELRDFGGAENGPGPAPFSVSPDGRWAAMVMRRADADADAYCIGVMLVALDGRTPARLLDTGGDFIAMKQDLRGLPDIVNGSPAAIVPLWSPDGHMLAWLRRDRGRTQIWVAALDGTPARQLTRAVAGIGDFAWSADGRTIRARTRAALGAGEAGIDVEGRGGFHYDHRFWPLSDDRPRPPLPIPYETIVVDVASGATVPTGPESSPKPDVPGRPANALQFAQSGGNSAWTARGDSGLFSPASLHVAIDGHEIVCPASLCADHVGGFWWTGSGDLLVLRAGSPANGGLSALYRWRAPREAAPVRLLETGDALFGCQMTGAGLICARETPVQPRRLVSVNVATGTVATLFDPNPEFARVRLGSVRRLSWTNKLGMRTYGDLVLPPDHRPGERHPLVVVQYQSRGFLRGGTGDEYPIHLLATRGFAVLSFQRPGQLPAAAAARDLVAMQRINIAGMAERRAILSSLEAGVDAVLALGVADPDRIGITGLSDGAVTVQFALAQGTRFRAAAISSCCDDPGTSLASAGLGYRDDVIAWGYPPPDAPDSGFWRGYSLAANADRMRTPLLIQVPDAEYRLALETYSALDYHGAPVDMFVFPDEHHVKAHPAHRLAIYQRNLAWFDFWLRDRLSSDPDRQQDMKRWQALRGSGAGHPS